MTVTMFGNLTEFMELAKSYKVYNLELTIFQNTTKLRSTNLTKVKCIEDTKIKVQWPKGVLQVPQGTENRIMFF